MLLIDDVDRKNDVNCEKLFTCLYANSSRLLLKDYFKILILQRNQLKAILKRALFHITYYSISICCVTNMISKNEK